ncbi:acyl-CoA thioesterase [Desulfosarcina ovata]|uniref:acyl-CoA thioesterase n=1 Tax=Desulfosarcina ovata TaxID=83564 RepID=UPI0012D3449A|nr:thioesterase family protein [Desulfosarcina ovata]
MRTFRYSLDLTVKKTDVNGFHVSYEKYFSFFHEAVVGYFALFGHQVGSDTTGIDLIVSGTRCQYKNELQQGDAINVECRVSENTSKRLVMDFQINKAGVICATGSTVYLFFDYSIRKVVPIPVHIMESIRIYEGFA